jgi:ribosome-associated protein
MSLNRFSSEDSDQAMERKSKSQVKREMLGLQSLGEDLVELSPDQIARIDMPEDLREAVLFAGKLKRGEALRRQLQYIGSLMREIDPDPIHQAVENVKRGRRVDAQVFRTIEQWRDGLVGGDEVLFEEIMSRFAGADRQRLRQLVLHARKESELNKPPKSIRALFRYLRKLLDEDSGKGSDMR